MADFQYSVRNIKGEIVEGVVSAANRQAAMRQLRQQRLLVESLKEGGANSVAASEQRKEVKRGLADRMPVNSADRIFFCRQLAMMVSSGMTLLNALAMLKRDFPKARMRAVMSEVLIDVEKGSVFSESLAKHEKVFGRLLVKIVESAEESGEMSNSLLKVAEHLEFWTEIRKKIIAACMYPAVIMLAAALVGAFMVFKIIPKFDDFLSRKQIPLPLSTDLVLSFSRVFTAYWWLLIIFIIGFSFIMIRMFRDEKGGRLQEKILLKIPVLGTVFLYTILGNFASTGALLLQSGLTVVESLRLLSGLSGFRIFQDVVNKAHSSVLKGKSLTDALEDPLMPPLVLNIVAVGEETGGLPDVLNELGSFYNRELNGKIRFFVSIIEPALLIVVGSLVAVVYFALFQAIIVMIGG